MTDLPTIAAIIRRHGGGVVASEQAAREILALFCWRPIETAPRDGTPILACGKGPKDLAVISWEPSRRCWACAWDNWPLEEFAATNWMLLPERPA